MISKITGEWFEELQFERDDRHTRDASRNSRMTDNEPDTNSHTVQFHER